MAKREFNTKNKTLLSLLGSMVWFWTIAHSDSLDTLLYARLWPFRTACFMNENKKSWMGTLVPVFKRPRFLHHGFRQPLALCMRKKKSKSLSLRPWVRAVSKLYNSIEKFTIPLSVYILMRGVQWALWFVTSSWFECRSDQRFAAKLSAWWAAKRRLIPNDRHGLVSLSILANKPSSSS